MQSSFSWKVLINTCIKQSNNYIYFYNYSYITRPAIQIASYRVYTS